MLDEYNLCHEFCLIVVASFSTTTDSNNLLQRHAVLHTGCVLLSRTLQQDPQARVLALDPALATLRAQAVKLMHAVHCAGGPCSALRS